MSPSKIQQLENVCYDIRGPVLEAKRLEEEGKGSETNIGNRRHSASRPLTDLVDVIRNCLPPRLPIQDCTGA
ncbi:Glutamate-pyruvate aminotransferase AlaA [Klebsiella pneumoniae]|nr:Glutamate-pyruvate aminotransferase AlaA [Klebsiella pneumoniae]